MSDLFTRPLELWRPSPGTSDGGGGTEGGGFAKVGDEPLLAKVDQPSAREQLVAATAGATLSNVIYFDGVVGVRRGDELRDPDTGEVWLVRSVVRPSDPDYTRANCEQRQEEA